MSIYYQAEVCITKQEDGLWHLNVPELKGGWVDTETLEDGFTEIQEVLALAVSYYNDRDWPMPPSVSIREGQPTKANISIVLDEHKFVTAVELSAKRKKRDLWRAQAEVAPLGHAVLDAKETA